jgi:DNA-binding MarR family transcriptional regulator
MVKQPKLTRMAQEIESHLSAVRQTLRQPVEAEFARGRLTGPQRIVMQALFHSSGLSLKELSRTVGLAHSTVSGIVDRLEKSGMAERRANPNDGRTTTIVVTRIVREFMRDTYPAIVLHPVTAALRRAKPAERTAILDGLRTLRRVVEEAART